MSTFGPPPSSRSGFTFVNKGGSIHLNHGGTVFGVFDVLQCTIAGQTDHYLVTLPTKGEVVPGYVAGNVLTYNAKGTSNANSDNQMTVLQVVGPVQFICHGPLRLRI